ncbi:MAG: tetratricopeptide repeat protein, partial [Ktedonobacterales bacterium]
MGRTALRDSLRGAEAEIAAGHPEQALARVQEVQARFPRALPVQRVLGEVYLALRKSREALGSLDRALAGNPEDARACCARSIVNQIQGDTLAALAWYRRACDISPDDTMLRAAYRELAANLGQPPYAPSRLGLARLYLRGDLFAHAIREFETLAAEQPDALEAQVGLVESLWRADQFGAATEWCRRLLANAPSCVKALLILAAIEHDAGHADEAQRLLRRAGELDPDQQIAQTLFADRLDAGDRALRTLLFGEDAPPATIVTDTAAALVNGRPSVHSLPLNGAGAE